MFNKLKLIQDKITQYLNNEDNFSCGFQRFATEFATNDQLSNSDLKL